MDSDIGNIKAIREWTRRYFYTKQDINFFMTKLDQGLKGYALMIIGPRNKRVTINPGNYQFTLNSDGWYRYLFFFERNSEITLSVQDGETVTYQLNEYNDTINLSPYVLATPQMTGYFTPSGYITYSGSFSGYPWTCFDRNENSYSSLRGSDNKWITYEFPESKVIYNAEIIFSSGYSPNFFNFQGSNDNTTWTTLYSKSSDIGVSNKFEIEDPKYYLYYRFWFGDGGNTYKPEIKEIKLYTVDQSTTSYKLTTPTMTSYTAPRGKVTCSNDSYSAAWHVFDNNGNTDWQPGETFAEQTPWIKYQFGDGAKCIKKITILMGYDWSKFTVYASNDDTNWDNLGTYLLRHADDWYIQPFYISNSQSYIYYKLEFGTWNQSLRLHMRELYLYEEV